MGIGPVGSSSNEEDKSVQTDLETRSKIAKLPKGSSDSSSMRRLKRQRFLDKLIQHTPWKSLWLLFPKDSEISRGSARFKDCIEQGASNSLSNQP